MSHKDLFRRDFVDMRKNALYNHQYVTGYWDGVKDAMAGRITQLHESDVTKMPINAMAVSRRAKNCLIYYGCTHVSDVIALSSDSILRIRNLGSKTADEIAQWLIENGILCSAWSAFIIEK